MSKEDVLKQLKTEEDFEYADNKGRKIGYAVFTALFIVFVIASLHFGQMAVLYAVSTLFWSFFSADGYAKHHFLKKRKYFLRAIIGTAAFVFSIFNFVLILPGG